MTEQQHPITPSQELVQQWFDDFAPKWFDDFAPKGLLAFAIQAARWGADQELEECCEWLGERDYVGSGICGAYLRAARRPKPPSLAEQGLAALKRQAVRSVPSLAATKDCEVIRTALERLQELENNG